MVRLLCGIVLATEFLSAGSVNPVLLFIFAHAGQERPDDVVHGLPGPLLWDILDGLHSP